jgi:hypothetical protein
MSKNNFTGGGVVTVAILGDINGDSIVDLFDAIILSGHFNQHFS